MANLLLKLKVRRLRDDELPWRFRGCLVLYATPTGGLAYVGKALDGWTVGDLWEVHELGSHPVTRQITKAYGPTSLAVYMVTLVRRLPEFSLEASLIQAERQLIRAHDPPGNRGTTAQARAEMATWEVRDDLHFQAEGWPGGRLFPAR